MMSSLISVTQVGSNTESLQCGSLGWLCTCISNISFVPSAISCFNNSFSRWFVVLRLTVLEIWVFFYCTSFSAAFPIHVPVDCSPVPMYCFLSPSPFLLPHFSLSLPNFIVLCLLPVPMYCTCTCSFFYVYTFLFVIFCNKQFFF